MICPHCHTETTEALTCEISRELREQQGATFRSEAHEGPERCTSCGVAAGGHHHAFCGLMIPHRLACDGCEFCHIADDPEALFGFDPCCGQKPVDPGYTDADWRNFIDVEAGAV